MTVTESTGKGLAHQRRPRAIRVRFHPLEDALIVQAAGTLEPGDFSLEKHRRVFKRMGELQTRGEKSTASRSPTNS